MKIRYYGHVGQRTGFGIAAENMCRALLSVGVDLEIRALAPYDIALAGVVESDHQRDKLLKPGLQSCLRVDDALSPDPDAVIVHTLPTECPRVVEIANLERFPRFAYTTWEMVDRAPAEVTEPLAAAFQQVWVPSRSSAAMMDGCRRVPHAFDWEAYTPTPRPKVEGAYRFLYVGAWNSRKNPAGLLRAYAHAFTRADDVELVIHSLGAGQEAVVRAMCATAVPQDEFPKLSVITSWHSHDALRQLYRSSHCYVTATRGEGWNLPAFEALVEGCRVIAPSGMGHDDFLLDTGADLYSAFSMPAADDVVVKDGVARPIGPKGSSSKNLWREPDLRDLALEMRDAYHWLRTGPLDIQYNLERYSYKDVGKIAVRLINEAR